MPFLRRAKKVGDRQTPVRPRKPHEVKNVRQKTKPEVYRHLPYAPHRRNWNRSSGHGSKVTDFLGPIQGHGKWSA
jgi:hypothetical protein